MTGRGRGKPIHTLREAIAAFFEVSGLGRQALADQVARAWCEVVGPDTAKHTRLARHIRRGMLHVEVDSSSLLAELSGFRKAEILEGLRERVKRSYIEDIRFRLGSGF